MKIQWDFPVLCKEMFGNLGSAGEMWKAGDTDRQTEGQTDRQMDGQSPACGWMATLQSCLAGSDRQSCWLDRWTGRVAEAGQMDS